MKIICKKILFSTISSLTFILIYWQIFKPIYISDTIIISFAIHPFNICDKQPFLWNLIKNLSIVFYIFSNYVLFFSISKKIFHKKIKNKKNYLLKLITDLIY